MEAAVADNGSATSAGGARSGQRGSGSSSQQHPQQAAGATANGGLASLVADAEREPTSPAVAPPGSRVLRVEVNGLLHDWFDVDEMGDFVRSSAFASTLRENVSRYFGVPLESQAIYDEDGLLTTGADFSRALQRVNPKLYVYDVNEMGRELRERTVEELETIDAEVEQSWRHFGSRHARGKQQSSAPPAAAPPGQHPSGGSDKTISEAGGGIEHMERSEKVVSNVANGGTEVSYAEGGSGGTGWAPATALSDQAAMLGPTAPASALTASSGGAYVQRRSGSPGSVVTVRGNNSIENDAAAATEHRVGSVQRVHSVPGSGLLAQGNYARFSVQDQRPPEVHVIAKGLQKLHCGENRAVLREDTRTEDGQPYSLFAPANQGTTQVCGAAAVVPTASMQTQPQRLQQQQQQQHHQQQRPIRVLSAGASSRVKTTSYANGMELSAHLHSTGNLAGDTSPTAPLMPMVLQAAAPSNAGTVRVLPKFASSAVSSTSCLRPISHVEPYQNHEPMASSRRLSREPSVTAITTLPTYAPSSVPVHVSVRSPVVTHEPLGTTSMLRHASSRCNLERSYSPPSRSVTPSAHTPRTHQASARRRSLTPVPVAVSPTWGATVPAQLPEPVAVSPVWGHPAPVLQWPLPPTPQQEAERSQTPRRPLTPGRAQPTVQRMQSRPLGSQTMVSFQPGAPPPQPPVTGPPVSWAQPAGMSLCEWSQVYQQ